MRKSITIILILIGFTGYSQIKFEKGYIIKNDNTKIECLIKNNDWRFNPDEIYYKLSTNSDPIKTTINDIKEFGISSNIKYKKFKVNVDISSKEINDLTLSRNPILREQTLLLKQLVEGETNLFVYKNPSMTRFFYSMTDSNIEQLIYKHYKTNDGKIAVNNRYKQQLLNSSKCKDITVDELNKLNYSKKNLKDFFVKYNTCIDSNYIVYDKSNKKTSINFKVKSGINFSSMTVNKGFTTASEGKKMDNHLNYRISAEIEFLLPFNKNKWAVFLEPSFSAYNEELAYGSGTYETNLKIKFNYFEAVIAARHYLYLNDTSKLNLSLGLIYTYAINPEIIYDMPQRVINPTLKNIDFTPSIRLGVGYNINNLSFEALWSLSRQITGHSEITGSYNIDWESNMKSISFNVGYRLF